MTTFSMSFQNLKGAPWKGVEKMTPEFETLRWSWGARE